MSRLTKTKDMSDEAETRRSNLRFMGGAGVFFLILVAVLAFFANQGMHSSDLSTPELVAANYQVQDAQTTRTLSFNGNDVVVSVDGKVHTCRALTDDYLLSKQPITCDDGAVIKAKP